MCLCVRLEVLTAVNMEYGAMQSHRLGTGISADLAASWALYIGACLQDNAVSHPKRP
jgi:hypothetical protein